MLDGSSDEDEEDGAAAVRATPMRGGRGGRKRGGFRGAKARVEVSGHAAPGDSSPEDTATNSNGLQIRKKPGLLAPPPPSSFQRMEI